MRRNDEQKQGPVSLLPVSFLGAALPLPPRFSSVSAPSGGPALSQGTWRAPVGGARLGGARARDPRGPPPLKKARPLRPPRSSPPQIAPARPHHGLPVCARAARWGAIGGREAEGGAFFGRGPLCKNAAADGPRRAVRPPPPPSGLGPPALATPCTRLPARRWRGGTRARPSLRGAGGRRPPPDWASAHAAPRTLLLTPPLSRLRFSSVPPTPTPLLHRLFLAHT